MPSVSDSVTVTHESGLHARPASQFVQTAAEFEAQIEVTSEGADRRVDAASSIGVMSLGVEAGQRITITAEGADAETAVRELVGLVEREFDIESDG